MENMWMENNLGTAETKVKLRKIGLKSGKKIWVLDQNSKKKLRNVIGYIQLHSLIFPSTFFRFFSSFDLTHVFFPDFNRIKEKSFKISKCDKLFSRMACTKN